MNNQHCGDDVAAASEEKAMSSRKRSTAKNLKPQAKPGPEMNDECVNEPGLPPKYLLGPEDDLEAAPTETLIAHSSVLDAIRFAALKAVLAHLASLSDDRLRALLHGCGCRINGAVSEIVGVSPNHVTKNGEKWHDTAVGPVSHVYYSEADHFLRFVVAAATGVTPSVNSFVQRIHELNHELATRIESEWHHAKTASCAQITAQ